VYRCGFATTQAAYDEAFAELFATLDSLESRLAKARYLCGDRLTLADVRLFPTLIRFDVCVLRPTTAAAGRLSAPPDTLCALTRPANLHSDPFLLCF
jgi:glutathione S-transferase